MNLTIDMIFVGLYIWVFVIPCILMFGFGRDVPLGILKVDSFICTFKTTKCSDTAKM